MNLSYEEKQKVDTEVLESFWMQFQEFKDYVDNATPEQQATMYYKHRKNIVDGITKVYSTLDNDLRTIVDMRYWYKNFQSDWAEIADELFMKVGRAKRKRDCLMKMFSDAIGWV